MKTYEILKPIVVSDPGFFDGKGEPLGSDIYSKGLIQADPANKAIVSWLENGCVKEQGITSAAVAKLKSTNKGDKRRLGG